MNPVLQPSQPKQELPSKKYPVMGISRSNGVPASGSFMGWLSRLLGGTSEPLTPVLEPHVVYYTPGLEEDKDGTFRLCRIGRRAKEILIDEGSASKITFHESLQTPCFYGIGRRNALVTIFCKSEESILRNLQDQAA